MTWARKLMGAGIRQPLFCPFWEKDYCTECKRNIQGGVEVD